MLILKRDGKEILRCTSDDKIYEYIHKTHPYSVDHALAYEGYSIEDDGTILIDPKAVAEKMLEAKKSGNFDGWTNQLMDTFEEMYGLEAAVQKHVGMDAEEYASTYDPNECRYEFDGRDTDGTRWYKCLTHDERAPSDMAPCAGYKEEA